MKTQGTKQASVNTLIEFIKYLLDEQEYNILGEMLDACIATLNWQSIYDAIDTAKSKLHKSAAEECLACKTRLFCRVCSIGAKLRDNAK